MKCVERRPLMDATTAFFHELGTRGHEPLLEKATGTIRFEVTNGRRKARWLVTVAKGDVTVSHRNARADCVIRVDRGLFDQIVTGEENAMAAMLRGAVGVEGRPELLVLFQRLFPAPPRSRKQS
jgi:putative sterol carrier protein